MHPPSSRAGHAPGERHAPADPRGELPLERPTSRETQPPGEWPWRWGVRGRRSAPRIRRGPRTHSHRRAVRLTEARFRGRTSHWPDPRKATEGRDDRDPRERFGSREWGGTDPCTSTSAGLTVTGFTTGSDRRPHPTGGRARPGKRLHHRENSSRAREWAFRDRSADPAGSTADVRGPERRGTTP